MIFSQSELAFSSMVYAKYIPAPVCQGEISEVLNKRLYHRNMVIIPIWDNWMNFHIPKTIVWYYGIFNAGVAGIFSGKEGAGLI